jgi:saxitoxin biosynthesis operon SxtJ-like protein
MHEQLDRKARVEGSSDRAFGLVMAAFFALVAIAPLVFGKGGGLRLWALAVSAVFLGLALLWTAPLAPLNRVWFRLGMLLHRITSPVILALLYGVGILPVGLVMRAVGKDPLRLRRNADAPSYWIVREPPGPAPETMANQY